MEVRSALWQKVFTFAITTLFGGVGLFLGISPFVPALLHVAASASNPADVRMAKILGPCEATFLLGFAVYLWRSVFSYVIQADDEGISQSNGFVSRAVVWSEVAAYYVETNRNYDREQHLHPEPVLMGNEGQIIFRAFGHKLVSTRAILEQRRQFWQFVEDHLEGKRISAPVCSPNAEQLEIKNLKLK